MLQVAANVAPDGETATVRARDFNMGGEQGGRNHLREGTYVNRLMKRNGVWMFSQVHFYLNMATDFDKGWGKDAQPIATVSTDIPPDRPPSLVFEAFPKTFDLPWNYTNPVTGK